MKTTIRKFNNNDIQIITNIFNEVVNEGDAFLSEKPLTTTQMEYRLQNEEMATYVAVTNGTISGCYMLRPNLKGRGNHVGNGTYFVTRPFRGKGIGYLLGKHSLEKAKEYGFKAMQFNSVVSINESSLKLWKKLVFQTIGIVPEGYRLLNGKLVDILILHKIIN